MTDWDAQWQAGETPWDKGEAAPPLLEFLDGSSGALLRSGTVLVPGCGSGHDVRAIAAAGATVTGLDLSVTALEVAASHLLTNGETYRHGDFLDGDFGSYDALWEHTCFCAIDPADRSLYAKSAARVVRPGGHLIGVFYLTPWDPEEEHEGPPHGSSEDEIVRHLSPWFSLQWGKVPDRAFSGREGREWLACFVRLSDQAGGCGEAT